MFHEDVAEFVISVHICDSNGIWTHNHLVHIWTLAKWIICVLSTYLYGTFKVNLDSIVAWMLRNALLKTGDISSLSDSKKIQTNTQPFSQTGEVIENMN